MGVAIPGIWAARLMGKDVHLCAEYLKTDISAWLKVKSGLDPFFIATYMVVWMVMMNLLI